MYLFEKLKRFLPSQYKYLNSSYSQEGEDILLQRLFSDQRYGFYVDVGAHHPVRFSNTFALYKKGWTGINIEPNPDMYSLFKKNRPRDINVNCGVDAINGTLEYYMFNEPALNTFDPDLVKSRLSNTTYFVNKTIQIEVHPLSELLEQFAPKNRKIDFLSVDVEGLDLNVLMSNNWAKFRPQYLLAEQLELESIENLDFPIHHYMKSVDYQAKFRTYNTIIYKDSRSS
ncbi:FkbM family methyltransferase [Methylophilus aquaticus]|uniref:FkbM family methyltransferase n=1 Tax=Methylophilus aquaticus TaxID=1971610 RepID=A0ABT9JU62_9PROT|nr:FkbM family methyltransferase [Methylophilus aquaticus]MDP8568088.1 FkbM family methyltransferase [Methylophilus aquaticus]